jgi:hypothetical protein
MNVHFALDSKEEDINNKSSNDNTKKLNIFNDNPPPEMNEVHST